MSLDELKLQVKNRGYFRESYNNFDKEYMCSYELIIDGLSCYYNYGGSISFSSSGYFYLDAIYNETSFNDETNDSFKAKELFIFKLNKIILSEKLEQELINKKETKRIKI